jgi:natural product precursor
MKKLSFNKKLSLNKETVATLDKSQMMSVKGGFTYSLSTGDRCQSDGAWASCCCGRDPRTGLN